MSIYTEVELRELGFAKFGKNLHISKKASFYGTAQITLGDNIRIDDFCVLSAGDGGIEIGSFIHIGVFSSIIGSAKIKLSDYCNISSKVAIYSSNDDYSGDFMTNPMVPSKFTNVKHAPVIIGKHTIIGSGTVVLPGANIEEGCAVGALSLVVKPIASWGIFAGIPVRYIKKRNNNVLSLEQEFSKKYNKEKL